MLVVITKGTLRPVLCPNEAHGFVVIGQRVAHWVLAVTFGIVLAFRPLSAQDELPDPLAIPPGPAQQYATSPGGVDMRTGQYTFSSTDLQSGGVGGISLVRTNGVSDWKYWNVMGQFAHNWHIYATYTPIKGGGANFTVEGARGQQFLSGSNSNAFFIRAASARETLQAVPTGSGATDRYLIYTAADGTKITFRENSEGPRRLQSNPSALLQGFFASKVEEPNGVTYSLTYDPPASSYPALLRRVTSNTGYVLVFEWTLAAGWKMVSKACLFNTAEEVVPATNTCANATYKVSYGYGSNGYMTSATDAVGNTSTYSSTYSQAAWNAAVDAWPNTNYTWTDSFYYPGSATPYLTNTMRRNLFYQYVQSQNFAAGADYTYSWRIVEHSEIKQEVVGGTATRSDGSKLSVAYQAMKRPGHTYGDSYIISEGPSGITDELGRILSADYCVQTVIQPQPGYGGGGATGCAAVSARYWKHPEGNRSEYTYNGWGGVLSITDHPKPGSSEPVITRTFAYDCSAVINCRKPISVTDGKGNTTNASYSPIHGGILKRTPPADVDGIRPETRYTYAQKYTWKKNGSGYVASTPPVWVLVSEEYCRTSSADAAGNCAAGAADEVVTTYEYEAGSSVKGSNLRLLGTAVAADGQSLRTCFSYDKWGRRISETQPKAGLANCQ